MPDAPLVSPVRHVDRQGSWYHWGVGVGLGFLGLLLALPTFGLGFLLVVLAARGFMILGPNEAMVFTLFGKYSGTLARPGVFWVNPLAARRGVSLRVANFASEVLKVNDLAGNPIEIAAVVTWRVGSPAAAVLDVEDYRSFVAISAETSIRALAARYNYDEHEEATTVSLRGSADEIAHELATDLAGRLVIAGVAVGEARISHLAYAPEIAQAMLRRQQASAVIAARKLVVAGAVGMVKDALAEIEGQGVARLTDLQRATMVNNLLVALVSESEATQVISTGTL